MKRLMKIMVAAVISVCLLAINLPVTTLNVRADGNTYQLSNTIVNDGNDSREEPCLTIGNESYYNTPDNVCLDPGTINVQRNTGNEYHADYIKIELDGAEVLNTTDSSSYTLTSRVKVEELRIASDPIEGSTDPAASYIYLRLVTEYTITVTSDIYRTIEIKGSDEQHNLVFETICSDSGRNGIYEHTYTYYVYERPVSLVIDNPGGVGGEDLLRLTGVTINGQAQQIRNRYDRCVYNLPSGTTTFNIVLRCDNTPGRVVEWVNSDGDNAYCPNITDDEVFRHGSAKIVGVYSGDDINNLTDVSADYDLTNGCVNAHGCGTLRVERGYWIAFEFTPDPGYQLWSFQEKELSVEISSSETTNTYLFRVRDGNVHFIAEFREAGSFVTVEDGTMIAGGDVVLNDFDINGGSARVNVQPQDPAIYANDEAIASICEDNELEVQDYLNIDLDQVYHIANTENGYWTTNSFHDLGNGYAEITLEMAEDFHPETDSICLIHDRGEGVEDRYETINAQYDQETNTITFRTNGFSNYLIAAAPDGSIDNENPDDERPHYLIENTSESIGLYTFEYHEDIDDVVQMPCEPGFFVQDDAIIDLSESVPGDVTIKMNIDGEVIDYEPGFCPEHWVIFDGVTVDGNTCTFNFSLCWNVTVGAVADASIAVYGENGLLTPIGECRDNPVSVNIDENEEEPFAVAELFFDTEPSYINITGNDYMMMYISGVEDEDLSPLGTTTVNYPEENRGFMWVEIGGIQRNEEDTYIFDTEGIAGATYTINGSASGDHAIVIQSFASSTIPASVSSAMSSLIEGSEYSNAVFLYGFDIYLVDGNGIVTDPGYSVTITIRLEEAIALEDGQTLFLVHMHGEGDSATYELIEVVYDATNKTITFTTSSFSPFVLNKGTKTDPVTPAATPANEETPAAQATTTEAAPAAAAATTTQAAAQAARTGEAQSYNGTVGIILILSAAALVFYVWRKETELEWYE